MRSAGLGVGVRTARGARGVGVGSGDDLGVMRRRALLGRAAPGGSCCPKAAGIAEGWRSLASFNGRTDNA